LNTPSKSKNEQIAEGLQFRIDQVNEWRSQQLGYLTSLYVNEHISYDEYCEIADRIHKHYDDSIQKSHELADKIRNS